MNKYNHKYIPLQICIDKFLSFLNIYCIYSFGMFLFIRPNYQNCQFSASRLLPPHVENQCMQEVANMSIQHAPQGAALPPKNVNIYHNMPNQYFFNMRYIVLTHYENMPMQYTEIFKVVKNENFR